MAITVGTPTLSSGNPSTSFTLVIHSSVQTGDILHLSVVNRDATADPSVTDNDSGGNTWTKLAGQNASGNGALTIWWKRATSATASKTITVSGLTGSSSGIVQPYRGCSNAAVPYNASGIVSEANASGNETQAEITTVRAGSMVFLDVANTANDTNNVTSQAATSPSSLTERGEPLSTAGSDCSVSHASAIKAAAGATGAFTWAQTNGTTASIAGELMAAIDPLSARGAGPSVLSIIQSKSVYWNEGGTSHTFTPNSALTPGSMLVLCLRGITGGVTISALSDATNGSWGAADESRSTSYIFSFENNASSGTPTITVTSSAGFERIGAVFFEVGGAATASAIEDTANNANVGTTDCRFGSLTTSVETMVIGMFYANAGAFTPDTGYTEINFTDVPTADGAIYKLVAAGTFNPGGTYAGATNSDGVVVAIKAGASTGFSLTGQNATLTRAAASNPSIAAAQGSFAETGQAAGLQAQRKVVAAQASVALSGQAANLNHGYRHAADSGSFALSGQAAGLRAARLLSAAFGSFAETGQAVILQRTPVPIAAAQGAFALSGQVAVLRAQRLLSAAVGSFGLSGQAAGLRAQRLLSAALGSFAMSGQAATPYRTPAPLPAAFASFSFTGRNAVLTAQRRLGAAAGIFTLGGQAAALRAQRLLSMAHGAFSVSGQAATLTGGAGNLLAANHGSFALSGQAAGLAAQRRITGAIGSYALTGQAAALLPGRRLAAAAGSSSLTGQAAALQAQRRLALGAGLFAETGGAATLRADRHLLAQHGGIALSGGVAGLAAQRWMVAAAGAFLLTGNAIGLSIARHLIADVGLVVLLGLDASLRWARLSPLYADLLVVDDALAWTEVGVADDALVEAEIAVADSALVEAEIEFAPADNALVEAEIAVADDALAYAEITLEPDTMIVAPTRTVTVTVRRLLDDELADLAGAELHMRRSNGPATGEEVSLTHASTGTYTATIAPGLAAAEWHLLAGSSEQADQCRPKVRAFTVPALGY